MVRLQLLEEFSTAEPTTGQSIPRNPRRRATPDTRQSLPYGYVDWPRVLHTVAQGKYRKYESWLVPVFCESCKQERLVKFSNARRLNTALCLKCSGRVRGLKRYENELRALHRRGDTTTCLGSQILWTQAFYRMQHSKNILYKDRRFSYVPIICVCGKKFDSIASPPKKPNYKGLCMSCSSSYKSWRERKSMPLRRLDRQYYLVTVTRQDIGSEMVKFRSKSPFAVQFVLEHRLIMAQSIGRALKPGEHVHHIDGNKLNNDLSNLLLVNAREHNAITKMETVYENKIKQLEARIKTLEQLTLSSQSK